MSAGFGVCLFIPDFTLPRYDNFEIDTENTVSLFISVAGDLCHSHPQSNKYGRMADLAIFFNRIWHSFSYTPRFAQHSDSTLHTLLLLFLPRVPLSRGQSILIFCQAGCNDVRINMLAYSSSILCGW